MMASKNKSASIIVFVFIVAIISLFTAVVPPIQSPDESAHLARAHMLSRGILKLSSVNGQSSGGQVDAALSVYMSHFAYLDDEANRTHEKTLNSAKELSWSDKTIFMAAPGTGYYFPALYAPYALGLSVGELAKLSVHNSYLLAKFICTIFIALCLVISARLFPFNPLLIYLLVLPTSLFQYASMNLDGIVAVISVLVCSLFTRIVVAKDENESLRTAFFILIGLLASCKLHLLALYALALFICLQFKNKKDYYKFFFSLIFVVTWTLYAVISNVDTRIELGMSSTKIAAYYLTNPFKFLDVLSNTFKYPDLALSYVYYLVSITPLRNSTYHLLAVGLLVLGVSTFSWQSIKTNYKAQSVLLLTAVASTLSIFFLLLVTWTPHPAPIIWGVQGRYFWIPAILLSFALSGSVAWKDGIFGKLVGFVLLVFVLISLQAEMTALIARYYMIN
jgi:uncharacterized membrane protein